MTWEFQVHGFRCFTHQPSGSSHFATQKRPGLWGHRPLLDILDPPLTWAEKCWSFKKNWQNMAGVEWKNWKMDSTCSFPDCRGSSTFNRLCEYDSMRGDWWMHVPPWGKWFVATVVKNPIPLIFNSWIDPFPNQGFNQGFYHDPSTLQLGDIPLSDLLHSMSHLHVAIGRFQSFEQYTQYILNILYMNIYPVLHPKWIFPSCKSSCDKPSLYVDMSDITIVASGWLWRLSQQNPQVPPFQRSASRDWTKALHSSVAHWRDTRAPSAEIEGWEDLAACHVKYKDFSFAIGVIKRGWCHASPGPSRNKTGPARWPGFQTGQSSGAPGAAIRRRSNRMSLFRGAWLLWCSHLPQVEFDNRTIQRWLCLRISYP